MQLPILVSVIGLLPTMATAGGGFKSTCGPNWYIFADRMMWAECLDAPGGTLIRSQLDLDHCMENVDGYLRGKDNGAYIMTCHRCGRGRSNGQDAWGWSFARCDCWSPRDSARYGVEV
ncbi:hypothetical protein B0J18DRAFT_494198, partial [Chaetomium sp. MPI-SDFR-AT-0129]